MNVDLRACRNFSDAWYTYSINNGIPYWTKVELPNHDGNLFCGEPWHDFGNYPSVGINENDEIYVSYREGVIVDITQERAWEIKEEGSWWDHSENNDTPGRKAFGIECNHYDIESVKNAVVTMNEVRAKWEVERKAYNLEQAQAAVKSIENTLAYRNQELETLKVEHPRAYRQIDNKQKEIANWEARLVRAKENLAKLEA